MEFKKKKKKIVFYFQTWKNRKTADAIASKLLKQLPLDQAKHITTEVLSMAKDPSIYQDRAVPKNEQMPIDIKISDSELVRPTMVSVNNTTDETVVKKRAEKRKMLEEQLRENTVKMNKTKKSNKL